MAISQFQGLVASCHVKLEFSVQALTHADLAYIRIVCIPICHRQRFWSFTPLKTIVTEATYDPQLLHPIAFYTLDCLSFLNSTLPPFLEMCSFFYFSFFLRHPLKSSSLFCQSLKFRYLSRSFVWPLEFNGSSWQFLVTSDS